MVRTQVLGYCCCSQLGRNLIKRNCNSNNHEHWCKNNVKTL